MKEFGAYLRSLRENRGLSRPRVHDLLMQEFKGTVRLSKSTLENWENGVTTGMSASRLACLVYILGADYEDVFSRLVKAQAAVAAGPVPARAPEETLLPNHRLQRPRGGRPGNGSRRRSSG